MNVTSSPAFVSAIFTEAVSDPFFAIRLTKAEFRKYWYPELIVRPEFGAYCHATEGIQSPHLFISIKRSGFTRSSHAEFVATGDTNTRSSAATWPYRSSKYLNMRLHAGVPKPPNIVIAPSRLLTNIPQTTVAWALGLTRFGLFGKSSEPLRQLTGK